MTRKRRTRITFLSTALAASSFAMAGPMAASGSAQVDQGIPAGAPAASRVEPPVKPSTTLAVDPDTKDGKAHHPLTLQVKGWGIDAKPLVTSASPTGYDPN